MKFQLYLLLVAGLRVEAEISDGRLGSLVAYWGQNSFGVNEVGGGQGKERPLRDYCHDATYDVLVLSFLTKFNAHDPKGFPELNLGSICDEVAEGIKFCQKEGKRVLLSMGGLSYMGSISGGQAEYRPFLDAVLDGVDLDIEKGPPSNYAQFTITLHNIFKNPFFNPTNRTFVVTAAPQCPFPDAHLKDTLEHGWLDMVFVQFYNNPCGLDSDQFNLATWDGWASSSVNREVKIFIGAPASQSAASTGYMPHHHLKKIIKDVADKYSSFGGVMLWDVSQANMNLCPIENKLFSVAISHSLKDKLIPKSSNEDNFKPILRVIDKSKSEPAVKPPEDRLEKNIHQPKLDTGKVQQPNEIIPSAIITIRSNSKADSPDPEFGIKLTAPAQSDYKIDECFEGTNSKPKPIHC
ncbi:Chitinase 2 [Massospora cicadina]|nr:Chitinase 2 [Massospora cicadina]